MNLDEKAGWLISSDFTYLSHLNEDQKKTFTAAMLQYYPGGIAGFRNGGKELLFLSRGAAELLDISREDLIPGTFFPFRAQSDKFDITDYDEKIMAQVREKGYFRLNISLERSRQETVHIQINGGPVEDSPLGPYMLCLLSDTSGGVSDTLRLVSNPCRDPLTGLHNKDCFEEACSHYLKEEGKGGTHGLFLISLDSFTEATETLGQRQSDEILCLIGALLLRAFRENDCLGRIRGDQFMILMKDVPDLSTVEQRAESLRHMIRQIFLEFEFPPGSCSIGVTYGRLGELDFSENRENADFALYQSQLQGAGRWKIYCGS